MFVTGNWISKDWVLQTSVLDLYRFYTPHTGEAASLFLCDVISSWGLQSSISSITMYNAAGIVSAIELLGCLWAAKTTGQYTDGYFHVLCGARVIDPAVREVMKCVQGKFQKIRQLLSSIRA